MSKKIAQKSDTARRDRLIDGSITVSSLLAFAFGTAFFLVLAYAGLRSEPITDPGKMFLLRTLAAMSAAGVAMVLSGNMEIHLKPGPLMAVRAGGAMAIAALVYTVNPPALIRGAHEGDVTASMLSNYGAGFYDESALLAEDILRRNPDNHYALSVKGGVAFYTRQYKAASEYFGRAMRSYKEMAGAESPILAMNYASTMVELGGYTAAIDILERLSLDNESWRYSLGRAYLYANRYADAARLLETVSTQYESGAARILQAAAQFRLGHESNTQDGSRLSENATKSLLAGFSAAPPGYWRSILSGNLVDKHQGWTVAQEILKGRYEFG